MSTVRFLTGFTVAGLSLLMACTLQESPPSRTASPVSQSLSTPSEITTPIATNTPSTPIDPKLAVQLEEHIRVLSEDIGERNHEHPEAYLKSRIYLRTQLETMGYNVEEQEYELGEERPSNLVAERAGSTELVVVGAHYDSAPGTPGADDNASGCAALLELARTLKTNEQGPTVRFVLFANEEPPYFQTSAMGSLVYAAQCAKNKDKITIMFSLETLGYYSDESDSQHFPVGISGYPTTGNFLAFVSDFSSKKQMLVALERFKKTRRIAVEGLAAPGFIEGVGWSDHWSFWQHGYPAIMVTDTAPFRNPHYHQSSDHPKTLDFERLSNAVAGLAEMLERY